MIYLDNGATSFRKPPGVYRAVERAMYTCANPGRGGGCLTGRTPFPASGGN